MLQGSDILPNYDSLMVQSSNTTSTQCNFIEDQDYEFLEMGLQADDAEGTISMGETTRIENVQFDNGPTSTISAAPSSYSGDQIDGSVSIELGDFFKRPVKIHSYTWTEGALFSQTFAPWYDYFNNTAVKKKLDNYHLLKCDLKLKIVINAAPFYYGGLLGSYRPLANLSTSNYFEPCPTVSGAGLYTLGLMGRSQRPHMFIYPQSSQGSEMKLPFFYPQNWLNVNLASDFYNMGTFTLEDMGGYLHNANGVTGEGVSIQVYAWAEDIQLAGPTVSLSLQSKDEYGQGIVSGPASAVARFLGKFADWPVIGPYATATSFGASAVSSIASLLGYTNVPVVNDVGTRIVRNNPLMGTTDIGIQIEKLSLDSKNELSIDNKANGLDLGDELTIQSIVTREAYLGLFDWDYDQAAGTLLYNIRVTPENVEYATTSAINTVVQGTPSYMVSQLFKYWRGDMIYRFKILASAFHRGRLEISWDPYGDLAASTDNTNLVYTKIVDITDENDVEFVVPYTQTISYLNVRGIRRRNFGTSALTSDEYANGVLTVRVLNPQTSPVADAVVQIIAFARCAPNMEFASPVQFDVYDVSTLSPYVRQSADELSTGSSQNMIGGASSSTSNAINLIHMGETIVSLRQLMRRANFSRFKLSFVGASANWADYRATFARMPLEYGWDPNGINSAVPSTTTPEPFNFVKNTTINWINRCFIAHKGSVIWHVNTNNAANLNHLTSLGRTNRPLTVAGYSVTTNTPYVSDSQLSSLVMSSRTNGAAGLSINDQAACSGAHVSVPYYNPQKFSSNNPNYRTLGSIVDYTVDDSVTLSTGRYTGSVSTTDALYITYYCGIGTDFNSIFFLNVPALYDTPLPTGA